MSQYWTTTGYFLISFSTLRKNPAEFFWNHTFVSPSAFSRRAVVSYWRKYVHEVLVNRLGGLSLPRKSVVRLTDHPDMTLDVYRGRKATMQQQQQSIYLYGIQIKLLKYHQIPFSLELCLCYTKVLKYWDTKKIINFPFGTNGKLMVVGVQILNHNRVFPYFI